MTDTALRAGAQLKERLSPDGKTYLFLDEVQEIKGWESIPMLVTQNLSLQNMSG